MTKRRTRHHMSGCDNKLAVDMKLKDKDTSHAGII
jgi:hypothetical protein